MDRVRALALARRVVPFLEVLLVLLLAWWMFRVRMTPYDAYTGLEECKPACFLGTDPYYHLRAVLVSAAHFPDLLRWDPWTQFPNGTETGQFGTLFDLLIALAARLTGDPNDPVHVARVLAAAPAVYGAAIVVPVYLLGRRLGGRLAGAWAAVVLALLPGEFLIRSVAGYADHHVAEALFSTLALAGVLWAAEAGRRIGTGIPRWKALAPSAAGAVSLFLYLWTWPPGVLFVAILGVWVVVQLLLDGSRGTDTRGFAWAMGLSFGGASLLTLLLVEQTSFAFNLFSLLQPLSLAAVALAAVGLDEGARLLRKRKLPRWILPAGAAAIAILAIPIASAAAPSLYGPLRWGFSWVTGIGTTANILTIQEARATCDPGESWPFCDTFARSYGLLLFSALAALPILAFEIARRRKPGDLLLFLWLFTMVMASTTQVRFNYYLGVAVAVANGWLVGWLARVTGLSAAFDNLGAAAEESRGKGGRRARGGSLRPRFRLHQPVAIAAVCMLAIPGLVVRTEGTLPADELAALFSPSSEERLWHLALPWLRENTPSSGIDLRKAYDRPPGGAFEYPDGAYGVLAWWDYGHWIQVVGERPPVANPFQQNAPAMSLYFTGSEPEAEALLAKIMKGDAYRARYVMISDADAMGKYGAITVWAHLQNASRPEMYSEGRINPAYIAQRDIRLGGATQSLSVLSATYRASMMSRLYFENADGLSHYRLVYAYPGVNCVGHLATTQGEVQRFNDLISSQPCTGNPDVVRDYGNVALQAGSDHWVYETVDIASLKIFEHVRGANLTGLATPGATVVANVTLLQPVATSAGMTNAPFEWRGTTRADADGRWRLTVPYSTGEPVAVADGGTNLLVRARGAYTIAIGATRTDVAVPDAAVLGGAEVAV